MKTFGILAVVVLIVLLVVFGPFFTIWALNTLFPILAIPYTLDTWAAVVLLGLFFKGNVSVSK